MTIIPLERDFESRIPLGSKLQRLARFAKPLSRGAARPYLPAHGQAGDLSRHRRQGVATVRNWMSATWQDTVR